jgi:endonuclease-3
LLWENVAYLVSDERRAKAFAALERKVGLDAGKLRAARADTLLELASLGGMLPSQRVEKLRDIADLALDEFGGDLESVLELPPAAARKALKKFPGIGEPGAEKILLFTGTEPVLALDSNGLRALLRLGYGTEGRNYAQSYKSAQRAAEEEIEPTCAARRRAHDLLRRHGQTLCKAKAPDCDACPLQPICPFAGTL